MINLKNIQFLFFSICIVSFWIMYFVYSFFNRLATDDYSMIALANDKGVLGGTIWFYYNWTGGFFGILFQIFTLYLTQPFQSLMFYNLFLLTILSYSKYLLLKELIYHYKFNVEKLDVLIISQIFIQLLFFSGLSISENWFWVVGSTAYIYPFIFLFLSLGLYFRYLNSNIKIYYFISLILIIIFCSYPVNYILIFLFFITLIYLYTFLKTRKFNFELSAYIFTSIIGFCINLFAPGNYIRKAKAAEIIEKKYSLSEQIFELQTPFNLILKFFSFYNALLIIAFGFPLMFLILSKSGKFYTFFKSNYFKIVIVFLFSFLASIAINFFVNYIALGWGIGSYRSMMPLSVFFILMMLSIIGILIIKLDNTKMLHIISIALLFVCIYRSSSMILKEYHIIKYYAQKHDYRTNLILEKRDTFKGEILMLEKLPPSGILLTAEISKDTASYINHDMRNYFKLPFAIAIE